MKKNILITGGAGFIGSHLADELIEHGYHVRVFDNLSPQVHGPDATRPDYLHPDAELIVGDVRDKSALKKALENIDVVFHLAALVGVGQSMYRIDEYTEVNNLGTANLLTLLIDQPVEKLIVASSMSLYGEGLYYDPDGKVYMHCERRLEDMKQGKWELYDNKDRPLEPIPTPEKKPPFLSSVYALSKYDQEKLCLMAGRAYKYPAVALRFFNVYGTRQALSNPYTGVLAIFASRLLNNNSPMIFEDGNQLRDFVHVKDVTYACRLAMEKSEANGEVFNIGSGRQYSIKKIALKLAKVMKKQDIQPEITGKYRVGDIRHCFSDLTKAKNLLGYEPRINFEEGLSELADWLQGQIAVDKVNEARNELTSRGLTL